jgi:hypothetical protein
MTEERLTCPKCGQPIARDDTFCKKCGADLRQPPVTSSSETAQVIRELSDLSAAAPPPEPPYEREYGTASRLLRVLYSPAETMKDIALAPDYFGVFVILFCQVVIGIIATAYVFTKVQVTGPLAGAVIGLITPIIALVFALAFLLMPIRWLVKSAIVWKAADSGSRWDFKSAASVTGYAYIADFVISLIVTPLLLLSLPTLVIDTSSLEAMRQLTANYTAQIAALKLSYTLPSLFLALLWKSYLGAVGTKHGTREMCKLSGAFLLFFLLGLILVAMNLFS